MELALTTLLLLPGAVSLAIATGRRCRATAPRDLPAALASVLGFAVANFALTLFGAKLLLDLPYLGLGTAVVLTGKPQSWMTREGVIAEVFDGHWKVFAALGLLTLTTVLTGWLGGLFHQRLLQIIARKEAQGLNLTDKRNRLGKSFDWCLDALGVPHLAIARGASYWLIVEQIAMLLAEDEPEVYADVTQGDDATLFAGQVAQVITSRTGETLSIVLKKARRYRRNTYGSTDPATGRPRVVKQGGWKKIGDSEAFYLRGDSVQNISYRVYGDPTRGGYRPSAYEGKAFAVPEFFLRALRRRRESPPLENDAPRESAE